MPGLEQTQELPMPKNTCAANDYNNPGVEEQRTNKQHVFYRYFKSASEVDQEPNSLSQMNIDIDGKTGSITYFYGATVAESSTQLLAATQTKKINEVITGFPWDKESYERFSEPLDDYAIDGVSMDYREASDLQKRLAELRKKHGIS